MTGVLEFHKTLTIDQNLVILACCPGSRHMKFIHDRQNRFNELSAITMRGGDEGKKKKKEQGFDCKTSY